MILLPIERSAYLKSFALSLCVLGLALAVLVYYCFASLFCALGLTLFLASFLAITFLRPWLVSTPYRLWNALAQQFSRAAGWILMAVCFYVVLAVVGRAGANMKLDRSVVGPSTWRAREAVFDTLRHEFRTAQHAAPQQSWLAGYLRWSMASRQLWAIWLIPFLALLGALEVSNDRRFPTGVYTLF